MGKEILRSIPKVDVILADERISAAGSNMNTEMKKEVINNYLTSLREGVLSGELTELPDYDRIIDNIYNQIEDSNDYSLRRVINATGVVLHTNLGRAPLGQEMVEHIASELKGYTTLEYDLASGSRGSRYSHVEKLLCEITSAEAAMVVNNNAAAVFLVLNTLAQKKNVAISRGELVEIGGAFRVPEIMARSWADLLEIGTTNKTHLSDYERAIDEDGAEIILKVHNSNFKIIGFSEDVEIEQLTALGKSRGVKVIFDLGAAFLNDQYLPGALQGEVPSIKRCMEAGTDILCFSGDKIFGSSQAGIILGSKEDIDKIRKNPFTRMFRIDKLTLGVLEMTLRYYKDYSEAIAKVPTLAMLFARQDELLERADKLQAMIAASCVNISAEVIESEDEPGGGSMPGVYLDGYAIRLSSDKYSESELERLLRRSKVPVISRIYKEHVLLSVRTLLPGDDIIIADALRQIDQGA